MHRMSTVSTNSIKSRSAAIKIQSRSIAQKKKKKKKTIMSNEMSSVDIGKVTSQNYRNTRSLAAQLKDLDPINRYRPCKIAIQSRRTIKDLPCTLPWKGREITRLRLVSFLSK